MTAVSPARSALLVRALRWTRGLVAAIAWAASSPAWCDQDLAPYARQIPGSDVSFDMAPIQGGVFRMGSPEAEPDREPSEGPQFDVRLDSFWIGKHEVTWAEYRQFMRLAGVFEKFDDLGQRQLADKRAPDAVTAPSRLYDSTFTYAAGEGPRQPAVSMSQYAAKQYTKWLSLITGEFYRLPTEAEWEYACRAGTTTAYSFGNDPAAIDDYAWHYGNSDDATHDVGGKKPNPWGLYDMHGNACEWVLDEHRPEWYASLARRPQPVAGADATCWPEKAFPRVLRGGSWFFDPPQLRSAARRGSDDEAFRIYDPNSPKSPWWFASDESQDVGFRLVRPRTPPPRETWAKYWDADVREIQAAVDHRIDSEGRGERGKVDAELPAAAAKLQNQP